MWWKSGWVCTHVCVCVGGGCSYLAVPVGVIYLYLNVFRHTSKEVRRLWEKGLPPSIRGQVWMKAIGNKQTVSHGEYLGGGGLWYCACVLECAVVCVYLNDFCVW